MRRSVAWALALALSCSGAAACGGDDNSGDGGSAGGTTAPATTTADPAAASGAIDEFCAKAEEVEALIGQMSSAGPASPEAQAEGQEELTTVITEAFQMKMSLDAAADELSADDTARYEECSTFLGDLDVQTG